MSLGHLTLVKHKPSHASYHELPEHIVFAAMAGVLTTMLMSALDQTIVSTAMPRIISELHGFQHYSGVITAYMVASTASVPLVGKLSDFYGRRFFLLIGVAIFVLASLLCGAAQSMTQLIFFRGIQGIGAGFCQAMAFTTIADLFPPAKRGRVSGLMGAVFGLASVIGPAAGGFLTDGPGWRYVFYVNLPVGLLAFGILYFYFPKIERDKNINPSIDYWGALTLVLSVVPILLALSWGGRDYPWSSPLIIGLLTFGAVATILFFKIETKAKEPIIPLHLFHKQIIWSAMAVSALVAVGMFGTTLFIPLFIQTVLGTSATKSGAVMMPMTLSLVFSAILTGQVIMRSGRYRTLAISGVALTGIGMFLLSQMDIHTSYMTILRNMIIMGVGLGATMPVFTLAVQNAVDVRFAGIITSTVQFVRSVGGALGAAIFGSVLANLYLPAFHKMLPADIGARIPIEHMAQFNNPQLLVQPEAAATMEQALNSLGERGAEILPAVRLAAQTGLANALHSVFLMGAILLALATAIAFLVKDIPLRKTNQPNVGLVE
ncbi:MAG: MDR family MFS transporter [Bdellovibrionales bacterium]